MRSSSSLPLLLPRGHDIDHIGIVVVAVGIRVVVAGCVEVGLV